MLSGVSRRDGLHFCQVGTELASFSLETMDSISFSGYTYERIITFSFGEEIFMLH